MFSSQMSVSVHLWRSLSTPHCLWLNALRVAVSCILSGALVISGAKVLWLQFGLYFPLLFKNYWVWLFCVKNCVICVFLSPHWHLLCIYRFSICMLTNASYWWRTRTRVSSLRGKDKMKLPILGNQKSKFRFDAPNREVMWTSLHNVTWIISAKSLSLSRLLQMLSWKTSCQYTTQALTQTKSGKTRHNTGNGASHSTFCCHAPASHLLLHPKSKLPLLKRGQDSVFLLSSQLLS